VRNPGRGTVLGDAVTLANTSVARNVGLLKHKSLPAGQGMWIVPCGSIHTCFMRFAIDLVYLDKLLRVRKVCHSVQPWRISACPFAHSVIELPAGSVAGTGTQRGDQLSIE
jgi:hypothetical protein